jgi:hypothetical protein
MRNISLKTALLILTVLGLVIPLLKGKSTWEFLFFSSDFQNLSA